MLVTPNSFTSSGRKRLIGILENKLHHNACELNIGIAQPSITHTSVCLHILDNLHEILALIL